MVLLSAADSYSLSLPATYHAGDRGSLFLNIILHCCHAWTHIMTVCLCLMVCAAVWLLGSIAMSLRFDAAHY